MFLLVAGVQTSWGFALLGPELTSNGASCSGRLQLLDIIWLYGNGIESAWQTPTYLGDIGGPHGYRTGISPERTPVLIYYAYDSTFLGFFGSNGVEAVDSAVAIMNSITNVDTVNLSRSIRWIRRITIMRRRPCS